MHTHAHAQIYARKVPRVMYGCSSHKKQKQKQNKKKTTTSLVNFQNPTFQRLYQCASSKTPTALCDHQCRNWLKMRVNEREKSK